MGDLGGGPLQEDQLAGGLLEGSDESAGLPARVGRYSKARTRAKAMVAHLCHVEALSRECKALADCGNWLLFRDYYTVGKVRLSGIHSCYLHLLCPLCAIRRGAKALKVYLDRFRVIVACSSELRPYLVTFTVANGPDLPERFQHLHRSLQTLHTRRRLFISGGKRAVWTESARAAAAVWSYEVTNRGNGWHPHVHAIWLCDSPPNRWALVEEWKAITGDSYVVDVRPLSQEEPAEGFCEVFKYAMKFGELGFAENVQAYMTLRGRRLIGSFGCFRGVKVPPELTDDLLDDLPYVEIMYHYLSRAGCYSVESVSAPIHPALLPADQTAA